MPTSTGTSNAAREKNIQTEIASGKDPKQAVAIGYSEQRHNIAKKAHSKDAMAGLHTALKNMRDCMLKAVK